MEDSTAQLEQCFHGNPFKLGCFAGRNPSLVVALSGQILVGLFAGRGEYGNDKGDDTHTAPGEQAGHATRENACNP